ncbi:MAG: nucleotidyl transferase AbiEii/AbiGii toxin family protein [Thermoplasmata archaeon]
MAVDDQSRRERSGGSEMIGPTTIKKIARENGVPPTTVERDYVQNCFLRSLYSRSDSLVFKGGTSIRKAFIENYRFSDDLDFTSLKKVDQEKINTLMRDIKEEMREENEVFFEDKTGIKDVATGWKLNLWYTSILSQNTDIRLTLDITDSEKEKIVTPVEENPLIHPYPDVCKIDLMTYSLKEITLEKLRALCDRGWPRDLYDVYNLWPKIERTDFDKLFYKKCNVRGVEPTVDSYMQKREKIRSAWSKSLRHQLKEVPDFEICFQKVKGVLEELL